MDKKQIKEYAEEFYNLFAKEGITDPLFILNQAICFFFLKKEEHVDGFRDGHLNFFESEIIDDISWSHLKRISEKKFAPYYLANVFPILDKQVLCSYKLTSFLKRTKLLKLNDSQVLYNSFALIDKLFTFCESNKESKVITSYDYGTIYEEFLRYYQSSLEGGFGIPSHISRLMSELLEPSINDSVYTPILSDGELLVSVYQKIVGDSIIKEKIQYDADGFANGENSDSSLSSEQFEKLTLEGNQESDEGMFLTIRECKLNCVKLQ